MSFGAVEAPPDERRPYNANAAETSSNQENIVVPYFTGVAKLAGDPISPLYNLTSKKVKQQGDSKGKGGGGDTGQKNWYADVALLFNVCADDAPNDAILNVLVNGEPILQAPLYRAPGTHYVAFSLPKFCQACRFYWGTKDQPIDNLVLFPRQDAVPTGVDPRDISTWPRLNAFGEPVDDVTELPGVANPKSGHYDIHGAYRNQGYMVLKQLFLGSSPNMPTIEAILARGSAFFAGARFEAGGEGVNPMGSPYELFTDPMFGAGAAESRLVQSSFQDTADALDAQAIKLAPSWRQKQSAHNLFADYFQYYDGWFRRAGSLIEAGYFDHGPIDVSALQAIGSAELVEQPKIKPGDLAETKNTFFVAYTNPDKWFKDDDTEGYIDQANYDRVGGVQRDARLDRRHIISGALAVRHNVEWGTVFALEKPTGSIVCRRDRINGLKPGKRFRSDVASLGLSQVWRVKKATRPSDRDGTIKFELEGERGIRPTLFTPAPGIKPPDFEIKPVGVEHERIVELPSGLKDSSGIQVQILWERPSNDILGIKVLVSLDDDLYTLARTQYHYAVRGKLAVAYSAAGPDLDTVTGLVVDLLGIDLDTLTGQIDAERDDNHLLAWCGNEIFSIGDRVAIGDGRFQFLNRRALYGTAKADHFIGDEVWFIYRDWLERIEDKTFAPAGSAFFKLQPFIYGGDFDIDLVGSLPFNFAGGAVSAVSNLQLTTSARVAAGRIESRIAATWDYALDQDIFGFEVATKRTDETEWRNRPIVHVPSDSWEVAPSTSYDVKVRPINKHGEPGAFCAPVTIVSASISPFSITGLELDGQGNDTECRERDFKFACRLNSPSSGVTVGGVIQTGVQDPAFAYILWQVFVGGVLVYDEQTVVNKFQFTESKNEAAFLRNTGNTGKYGKQGQPLTLNVYAVDSLRNVSAAAILTVQNSAPVAPTGLTARAANNRTIWLSWANGPETDLDENLIYENDHNDSATATLIAKVSSKNTDYIRSLADVTGDVTRYYWVRTRDTFGNLSPFSAEAHATSEPVSAIADIDDFEIDETKLSLRIIIVRGDIWADNSPVAGSIAWNAGDVDGSGHQVVYAGALHPIAAGSTDKKYVYWNVGDAAYTASDTPLDLAGGRFLIAQNRSGTHVEAWNSFANLVVGFANIGLLAVRDANILNLAVEKILAGIILGKEFVLRNDAGTPAMFRSYDWVDGVSGIAFGIGADGEGFLQINGGAGLIDGVGSDTVVFNAALGASDPATRINSGTVTIHGGRITAGSILAAAIAAGAITADKIAADAIIARTIQSDDYSPGVSGNYMGREGFAEFGNVLIRDGAIIRTLAAPTFTNDYDGTPLGSRTYNDNDSIAPRAHGPAGKPIRFSTDGSEVTSLSPYWPWYAPDHGGSADGVGIGPDDFLGFPLGGSGFNGTIRARAVSGPNGEFLGEEASIHLTHVPIDLLPLPAAPPPFIYKSSGARGASSYKVKIRPGVAGADILFSTDEGATYSAYTPDSEITLAADAGVMAYNVKDGYSPSAVATFYNTTIDPSWTDPGWNGPPGTVPP